MANNNSNKDAYLVNEESKTTEEIPNITTGTTLQDKVAARDLIF